MFKGHIEIYTKSELFFIITNIFNWLIDFNGP